MRLKVRWRMRRKLEPNSPETLLALGYYQYWVLRRLRACQNHVRARQQNVAKQQRGARGPRLITRREGHWDESVAYFEQALALDPRNVDLLVQAAATLPDASTIPVALKLYDRTLDIIAE